MPKIYFNLEQTIARFTQRALITFKNSSHVIEHNASQFCDYIFPMDILRVGLHADHGAELAER